MGKVASFANRLRELLDVKKISQADLSRSTGISESSVSHYLKGDWEGKQDVVYSIANRYNVSEAWLMGYDVPIERQPFNGLSTEEIIRSIPFIRTLCNYCDSIKKPDFEIIDHYSLPAYNGCLSYLIQYGSLKGNDSLFYSRFFGVSNISKSFPDLFGTSIEDCLSAYSREEVNIIRAYRDMIPEEKNMLLRMCGLEDNKFMPVGGVEVSPVAKKTPKKRTRSDGFDEIDVYDQPAAAGLGNYLDVPVSRREQYPAGIVPPGTSFGVLISGDSMEPKICDTATVFVQSAPAVDPGEIGIFVLNGLSYCKQLSVDRGLRRISLHSVNPKYQDIEIGANDELRTIGRVLGSYPPPPVRDFEDEE